MMATTVMSCVLRFACVIMMLAVQVRLSGILLTGFNKEQHQIIVDEHNKFRRMEQSSNMKELASCTEMEKLANEELETCNPESSTDIKTSAGEVIGFTFYTIAGGKSFNTDEEIRDPLSKWYKLKDFYDHSLNTCNPGHEECILYAQFMSANSSKMGCSTKKCHGLGIVLVCSYYPPYIRNTQLYKKGEICSECPANWKRCNKQLCAREKTNDNVKDKGLYGNQTKHASAMRSTATPGTRAILPVLTVTSVICQLVYFTGI